MNLKYKVNQNIQYEKDICEEVNGYYQKIKTEIKEGFIFCIEIWENNIYYRVKKQKNYFGWDYVIENKVIKRL